MGYIEYLKGGVDEYGNTKWYYKFFSNNHTDVTDYFNFLGRKVKLKYGDVILVNKSPEELFKTIQSKKYQNYILPELEKIQKSVKSCCSNQGCSSMCSEEIMAHCIKLMKYDLLVTKNKFVREAMTTPVGNYINKGTKEEYDKQASKNMSYSSFASINSLNSKYNVPKYKITNIVNNGNTCELIDANNKLHVIDIAMILRSITECKVYIINLNAIQGWKYFTA